MQKERAYSFYQWGIKDIEKHFDVSQKNGLSRRTAISRLTRTGKNTLSELKDISWLEVLLRQFSNLFILILFAAALISYFVDGWLQSSIILLVIIINILLGFFQEYKAEKALSNLKSSIRTEAKVLRDDKVIQIPSEELVPGDVVVLESGDIVPADLRIIEANSIMVNESALTGESVPVQKSTEILPIGTILAEQSNMLFSSTIVTAGRGAGIVVQTGKETEFGKIADLVSGVEEKTPLEKQIGYIAKILTIISLLAVIILFLIGWQRGYEFLPLLTFVIALLVGAVPESLPTIITLSLAIGVSRMAKHKAIVRKLAAVETLGTIKIIATDKTGTLTNNELTVNTIINKKFKRIESNSLAKSTFTNELFEKAYLCSNVVGKEEDLIGDPLEIGIVSAAASLKIKPKNYKRLLELPFDSEKQYMAVVVSRAGKKELIVKGAPEKIATFCKSKNEAKKIHQLAKELSKEGLKVIAIASKSVGRQSFSSPDNLEFIGMIGLVDEPSDGIKAAIEKTIASNIRPVILTGDHKETAKFVAERIGLKIENDEIITGSELKNLSQGELKKVLSKIKIFARISPEDKINIVDKFEQMGFPVLVTGDGVNDAAAIKRASVGVAMGIKGTDVAKDSADIVLSDDRYGTIVSAIEYGRAIYDNIRNSVIFLISGNIDEIALVAFAFIFNLPIPLLTVQILWINMVTDSFPALALAFEKPSPAVLEEVPRSASAGSMKMPIIYSVYLALVGFVIGLIVYLWGLNASIDKARTLVFNLAVFQELVFVFSVRSPKRIWQNVKSFFGNNYLNYSLLLVLVLQIVLFFEPFGNVFGLVQLSTKEIVVLVISVLATFFLSEFVRSKMSKKLDTE